MSNNKTQLALKLNPIWKTIAKTLTDVCERCGKPRLYSIFDAYIRGERPDCVGCSAAYLAALPIISHIFKRTDLTENDIKTLLNDVLIRKSMFNVVRGIRHFGVRMPQPTAVPVVIVWNFTNHCNLNCIHCHQNSTMDLRTCIRAPDRLSKP